MKDLAASQKHFDLKVRLEILLCKTLPWYHQHSLVLTKLTILYFQRSSFRVALNSINFWVRTGFRSDLSKSNLQETQPPTVNLKHKFSSQAKPSQLKEHYIVPWISTNLWCFIGELSARRMSCYQPHEETFLSMSPLPGRCWMKESLFGSQDPSPGLFHTLDEISWIAFRGLCCLNLLNNCQR